MPESDPQWSSHCAFYSSAKLPEQPLHLAAHQHPSPAPANTMGTHQQATGTHQQAMGTHQQATTAQQHSKHMSHLFAQPGALSQYDTWLVQGPVSVPVC